jgi:hypothetical protein
MLPVSPTVCAPGVERFLAFVVVETFRTGVPFRRTAYARVVRPVYAGDCAHRLTRDVPRAAAVMTCAM